MSTKYTPGHPDSDSPGPWAIEENEATDSITVMAADGGFVADCTDGHISDDGYIMAEKCYDIARLIVAAPALLALAERLTLATDEGDDAAQGTHYVDNAGRIRCKGSFLDLIESARTTIAAVKATGVAA